MVVASGGGMVANRLVGKRIAFVRKNEPDGITMIAGGCFQQYAIAGAMTTFVLPDNVSYNIGSMFFVNPLTAIGLVQRIKDNKSPAAIQTGAAS